MSKYTPEQFTEMAKQALAARDTDDPRWVQLLLTLAVHTGIQPAECEMKIRRLAEGFE